MKHIECIFFLIFLTHIQTSISSKSETDYYQYLEQFGYTPKLQSRLSPIMGKSSFNDAITKFQRLYRLPETGELDEKTKRLMQRSRCGNPDIGGFGNTMHVEKLQSPAETRGRSMKVDTPSSYVTQENIWPKKNLKWFIDEYPKQQKYMKSKDHIRTIMRQAFNDWEKHSGLKFEMVSTKQEADLKIGFFSKDHKDGYSFDGPGATLAHAFYPKSGDIHFDDDEVFSDEYGSQNDEYTLRLVAAHEIGHALGLGHSFEENSLMFPVYQQFPANYSISDDDQQGIQKLYGTKSDKPVIESITTTTKTTITTTTRSTSSSGQLPKNNWCSGNFQTGCEGPDGDLYLFKDNHVWKYRARGKNAWDPQPTLINQQFRSLTDTTITACVKSISGYTYLFRNLDVWKVTTHWSSDGPHRIRGKNYPSNPRIALFHNNSIYFIHDDFAYSLNEFNRNQDSRQYPIYKLFDSPPKESIHSGFTYDKRHYLFTRNHVYVYDSTYGNLISGYPKTIPNGWFACDRAVPANRWNKKITTGSYRQRNDHHGHYYHEDDYDHHHHHRGRKRPFHNPHREHHRNH